MPVQLTIAWYIVHLGIPLSMIQIVCFSIRLPNSSFNFIPYEFSTPLRLRLTVFRLTTLSIYQFV